MSYVPQLPRRPVPTYNDFQSQAPVHAAPANLSSQNHVDTSDEAYAQAMRIIAARQAQSSFVPDPAARHNEGLADGYAYELQPPALPQRRQSSQTAPMPVPEPVYIGRQPDVYVSGTDGNHLIDNSRVHVEHNQRAYARHEGQIEAVAVASQRLSGRVAHWEVGTDMDYTRDIRDTGLSFDQLNNFNEEIRALNRQANVQVWDPVGIACSVMSLGIIFCVSGMRALKRDAWSNDYLLKRMRQTCQEHNTALAQAGVPALFRCERIIGVGWYLDIHHAG